MTTNTIIVRDDTELTVDGQTVRQAGSAPQTLTVNGDGNTLLAGTGAGVDVLIANGGANVIRGGAGADLLSAFGDGNTLIGGSGNGQQLYVAGDDALLVGGNGRNQALTVDGNDAVLIGRGDGSALLANGNNALLVGGTYGAHSLTVFGNDGTLLGGAGANTIAAYGNNNLLAVAGCDVQKLTASQGCGPTVLSADTYRDRADLLVERLMSSVDLPDMSDIQECGRSGWSWSGNGCSGSTGPLQALHLEGNNGVLIGGGRGSNDLYAAGNNNLLVAGEFGSQTLTLDGNDGVLVGGGWHGTMTVNGNRALMQAGGHGLQEMTANGNNATLIGGGGINLITANGNFNTLEAGRGVNTLIAAGTESVYEFDLGDGRTRIVNFIPDSAGANTLQFTAGIETDDLWFQRRGDDLRIDVNGSRNYVDVVGWFNGSDNQLAAIRTLDGGVLDTGEVGQLVAAMETLSNPYAGADPGDAQLPASQGLQDLLAAAWQA